MFLHIYRICPGSGFVPVFLHTDPTLKIKIRIRITDNLTVDTVSRDLLSSFTPSTVVLLVTGGDGILSNL